MRHALMRHVLGAPRGAPAGHGQLCDKLAVAHVRHWPGRGGLLQSSFQVPLCSKDPR